MIATFSSLESSTAVELQEADGVATLTMRLTYRDKESRDEDIQSGFDGQQSSFDKMEDVLTSLIVF